MQKKWQEGIFNLIFWLFSAYLIISSFSIQSQEIEIINGVENIKISRDNGLIVQLCLLVAISIWMFYYNLINLLELQRGASRIRIVRVSLGSFLIALLLYYLLRSFPLLAQHFYPPFSLIASILFFYYSLSTAYGLGKVWIASENRNQLLLYEKKFAELNLLRAQLQPHFLFNVLNNLLAMVDQKANPQLAQSIDKLSSLLRYVVYEAKNEKVSLSSEIAFIRDFATLYQYRFEEGEVEFNLLVKGNAEEVLIEPGIFIPLVENAFKYGILPETQSRIDLTFDLERPAYINFMIENPIHHTLRHEKGAGSGLIALKKRLALVYPKAHKLNIDQSKNYRVELSLRYD